MQPINPITCVLILGLELMLISHENDYPKIHLVGSLIMLFGWILNCVALWVEK